MRHSTEIEESIRKLEQDKNELIEIANLLKSIGESILNYSISLINLSNLLFEGYSVGGQRVDGNLCECVGEHKAYGDELLALADSILAEVAVLNKKIADENTELIKARQREAAEEEQRRARIRAAQRKKEQSILNEPRYLSR